MVTETQFSEFASQVFLRLDQQDDMLGQIFARFDQVNQRFERIDKRFDQVFERFNRSDERIGKLEEKVERMDQRLTSAVDRLDTRLSDHERESSIRFDRYEKAAMQNKEELKNLNTRVTALESWRSSYTS